MFINITPNKIFLSYALTDNGCQCYVAISETLFVGLDLPLIKIPKREVRGALGAMTEAFILGVSNAEVGVEGYFQIIYFYVAPMLEHSVILGKPWMLHNKAYPIPHLKHIRH